MGPVEVKPVGTTRYRHNCAENDNHLVVVLEDGELDELEVGDVLEKSRTVIGAKDLREALLRSGYDIARVEAAPGTRWLNPATDAPLLDTWLLGLVQCGDGTAGYWTPLLWTGEGWRWSRDEEPLPAGHDVVAWAKGPTALEK